MTNSDNSGYKHPPRSTRFPKGHSGNPNGRPRGRHQEPPFEAILGQNVTVTKDGCETLVTAEEAFLHKMLEFSLQGDWEVANALNIAMEEETDRQEDLQKKISPPAIVIVPIPRGSVAHQLRTIGVIRKLFAKQPHATFRIESWAVQKALRRFGDQRLSIDDQKIVLAATRSPKKVKWPEWWEAPP